MIVEMISVEMWDPGVIRTRGVVHYSMATTYPGKCNHIIYNTRIYNAMQLLLILELCNQRPNMRQQLNCKLISSLQKFLRVLRGTNARRSTSENDSSGRQGGTLR